MNSNSIARTGIELQTVHACGKGGGSAGVRLRESIFESAVKGSYFLRLALSAALLRVAWAYPVAFVEQLERFDIAQTVPNGCTDL